MESNFISQPNRRRQRPPTQQQATTNDKSNSRSRSKPVTDDSSPNGDSQQHNVQAQDYSEYLLNLVRGQFKKQIVNLTINTSSPQNYNFNLYDQKDKQKQ